MSSVAADADFGARAPFEGVIDPAEVSTPAQVLAASVEARRFNRSVLALLGAGLALLVLVSFAASYLVWRVRDTNSWVKHTYEVQSQITQLQMLTERAETARRGYLLKPRQLYLDTFQGTVGELLPLLDRVDHDTRDNPSQQQRVAQLRPLLREKIAQMGVTLHMVQAGDVEGAQRVFAEEFTQKLMVPFRTITRDMFSEENRLLKVRGEQETAEALVLLGTIMIGATLVAGLASGALWLMRRYARGIETSERALRELNEGLEAMVDQRTVELTRANEELQRFAYIVSHDLRSPLVNVMGFTSELEASLPALNAFVDDVQAKAPALVTAAARTAVVDDLPEAIGFIRSSTRKMDRLINAILKLSREGRRTLTFEPLSMGLLVHGVADSVRQIADAQGAQVIVDDNLPDLMGDRVVIEQIFSNLIENAVKYLKPGRPGRVVVRGRRVGDMAVYEVQDNGRGIDVKDQERVFELFRRAGPQDQSGEGIGLAHVRALVYRLGGAITVASTLDRGATFRLSLPRNAASEPKSA